MAEGHGSAQPDAVAANYRYWQEHGGQWVDEYAQRKQRNILYHIQEVMVADYLTWHAPARVLEFGCGVGRHLRNLCQIPKLEVFGYDQSRTMVQGCLRWTGQTWVDEHIVVGSPLGPLPYAPGEFDIVFTAEVLVHVRPEDLDAILVELLRVCRGHILHLETNEHFELQACEHAGCWKHDFVAAYARLGRPCELLPAGYTAHSPYRVVVGAEPRYTWSPVLLGLFRAMEADINRGMGELRAALEQQACALAGLRQQQAAQHLRHEKTLADAQAEARRQQAACAAAEERCAELERQIADLQLSLQRRAQTLYGYVTDVAREQGLQAARFDRMLHERDLFLLQADKLLKG